MTKLKFALYLVIILQLSCKTFSSQSPVLPSAGPAGSVTQSVTPSTTPTLILTENTPPPAPIFLPSFGPDYFSELHLQHDYWPTVAAAANLGPDASVARSVSQWRYSADGRYLAVAGCDAETGDDDPFLSIFSVKCENNSAHAYLFVLEVKTGNIIATLPPTGQATTVRSLDFSHDGSKLVYALSSGEVAIWDMVLKTVSVIYSEPNPYVRAEFSPDALKIAIRGNPIGKIWDVANQKIIAEIPKPEYGFPNFSADGETLQWQNYPNSVIYDTTSWQPLHEVSLPYNEETDDNNAAGHIVGLVETSPDLGLAAECAVEIKDAPVDIWDLKTGQKARILEGTWNNCGLLEFTPDGKWLLRFDESGRQLLIWQTDTWEYFDASSQIQNVMTTDDRYVIWLDFSADGRTVLVPTYNRLALYGLP